MFGVTYRVMRILHDTITIVAPIIHKSLQYTVIGGPKNMNPYNPGPDDQNMYVPSGSVIHICLLGGNHVTQ
jgi:hypothetical protein